MSWRARGPSPVWKLGWGLRGQKINEVFGDPTFPSNYPVIDKIPNGVATSVKSIDLNAATYQNEASLANRLKKIVDDVREFDGADWGELKIVIQTSKSSGAGDCSQREHHRRSANRFREGPSGAMRQNATRRYHRHRILRTMLYNIYLKKGTVYIPTTVNQGRARYMNGAGNSRSRHRYRSVAAGDAGHDPQGKLLCSSIDRRCPQAAGLTEIYRRQELAGFHARDITMVDLRKGWQVSRSRVITCIAKDIGSEDKNQTIEFPAGTSLDNVIDRMIAILQERAPKVRIRHAGTLLAIGRLHGESRR